MNDEERMKLLNAAFDAMSEGLTEDELADMTSAMAGAIAIRSRRWRGRTVSCLFMSLRLVLKRARAEAAISVSWYALALVIVCRIISASTKSCRNCWAVRARCHRCRLLPRR